MDDDNQVRTRVSGISTTKRYNFGMGPQRDLLATRKALRVCCQRHASHKNCCTFHELFVQSNGQIANLNRVLQNLRRTGEIDFEPECFFVGYNDTKVITLLESFRQSMATNSRSASSVPDQTNLFRASHNQPFVRFTPHSKRHGQSFGLDNRLTQDQHTCQACLQWVDDPDRLTIRGRLFHYRCVQCRQCRAFLRRSVDFIAFDGGVCCSLACMQRYDGAHVHQRRISTNHVEK